MRAVNLIPSEHRGAGGGGGSSDGAAYAVLAVLAGLVIFTLLYGQAHHQVSSRRAKVASLSARTARAEAAVTQLTPFTSFMALREQRMQAVSTLVDSRFDWAHALHELGRVLPKDVSITSLDGAIGSAATPTLGTSSSAKTASSGTGATSTVASSTPPGSVPTFTLSGCATSQSEVAVTLGRLGLIDGVHEVALQSSTKPGATTGTGGGGGSCPGTYPAFTVLITFDPLPDAASTQSASSTKLASLKGSGR
jgi:hypothetical protein